MLSFKIIFEIILVFWRCLMKIYRLGVLLLVLLFAAASPAVASNWYIGGGIESVTLGEDVDFVDNGGGLAFNFGIRFTSVTALDFTFSSSTHEEAGVDIDYGKFGVGPKFFFSDGSFQPFATVGIMSHVLDYQNVPYQIDGGGLFLGIGCDAYFDPNHSLGFSIISATWDAGDNFGGAGDGETGILRIVYNYHFK
jgi:hypothetical protein